MKKEEIFKFEIYVHPLSKIPKIIITDNKMHIYIKEVPEKNKANKAIIIMLKKIFNIPNERNIKQVQTNNNIGKK